MKLGVLFSGGKDSTYAAYLAKKYKHKLVCLITIVSENEASYMFHTPAIELTKKQAKLMGLPIILTNTAGEKEVRCWTIPKGWTAPQAGGTIHSDMENYFIKAEVVAYSDFKELQTTKGMADVKAAGKYRQEGRNYVVQDGDIIYFQVGKK